MRKTLHALAAAMALIAAPAAYADGPGNAGRDVAAPPVRAAPITPPANSGAQAPQGRDGVIPLNNGELTLTVPRTYKFYSAEEAYGYLQRNNAPAPSGTVLGLLAPAGADIRAPGVWASVVSYDGVGYVQSGTTTDLGGEAFEGEVRAARAAQNRPFEGFAVEPAFDQGGSMLAWAERAAPPGAGGKDYRHEQKVLGRYGVAGLTTLGAADQADPIGAAAADLRGMLSFPEGRRYGDFQAAGDQVSTYNVPGLITGIPADASITAEAASAGGGGAQTAFGGFAGWFPWIALGVVGVAIVGYMMLRRRGEHDEDEDEDEDEDNEGEEAKPAT